MDAKINMNIDPRGLDQIKGWNWGAFLLNWIWAIGNQVWIGLVCLVPFVGFIMMFVLGAKGNEWAWKAKKWESVEAFKKTQKSWTIAGLIVTALMFLFVIFAGFVGSVLVGVMSAVKQSDVYATAYRTAQTDPRVIALLGEPIEDGFFFGGSISVSGDSGEADISFPIEGPNGEATIYVKATKDRGSWNYSELAVVTEDPEFTIDLLNAPRN